MTRRIPVARLEEQVRAVLTAWGMPPEPVETTVAAMLYADRSGIDSHGVGMLSTYAGQREAGHLDPAARPGIVRETPAIAALDARNGLGHPAAVQAMRMAVDKARTVGIAAVSVVNSRHFGATGYYARLAAYEGLVGLVTTSTFTTAVVPTGGAMSRLGTNPIAFAAPGASGDPFVLDMSTSTTAVNKVRVYERAGTPLPDGWVVDGDGQTIRDPALAMEYLRKREDGGLTPMGGDGSGHKGYGLAAMVQILSAALSGADLGITRPPGAPPNIGHFLLALDPGLFRPDGGYGESVDELVGALRATPPAGGTPVQVAGDPEAAARADRDRNGIPFNAALLTEIEDVCARCGAPYLLG